MAGYDLTVNDVLTVSSGAVLQADGGETLTAATKTLSSGSTVTYKGDNDSAADTYTISSLFTDYHHIILNSDDGSTDTFQLGANITVAGNWTNTAGTFDPNAKKVTLDGTDQSLSGSTTFYDLTKVESGNNDTDDILTFTAGNTFTVSNALTLTGTDSTDQINLGLEYSRDSI